MSGESPHRTQINRNSAAVPWKYWGVVGKYSPMTTVCLKPTGVNNMVVLQSNSKATAASNADLLARLAILEAENAKLKESRNSLNVSAKGAVSVYGMGRFP